MPKDITKMQRLMQEVSYHYCERHDVYHDEWLEYPACALEITYKYLKDLYNYKDKVKEIVEKFNPENRR